MQSKLTYTKMTQNNTYFLLHGAPYKTNISSWQPPRYCLEFIFLQMETGCQLVPKMFSVTFLSGFCPQTSTNEEVRRKIQAAIGDYDELLTLVKKRKLSWFGHVSRASGLVKTILQGTVKGKRRRGSQKKTVGRQYQREDRNGFCKLN